MSTEMYNRGHPYQAKIRERFLLTGAGSTKQTYHISLESSLPYRVGDSIGVVPSNDPASVAEILELLGCAAGESIVDPRSKQATTLGEYLTHKANLNRISSSLFARISANPVEHLTKYLDTHNLSDLLEIHRSKILPQDLCNGLLPLLPRFYSIASSAKVFPHELHLTVAYVSYEFRGKKRVGVGSHFLCDLAQVGTTQIPIYVQASNHFTLPHDPHASMILIGPGTGVAPFRAFLQERVALKAPGRNWLFFGERHRQTDFYYEEFWLELEKQGHLRLDLAFSRDSAVKTYVQHKMLEQKKDLWNWLQQGSFLYVCGDANEMAKDVDAALRQIAVEDGGLSEEAARLYFKQLRTEKRYLLDVY